MLVPLSEITALLHRALSASPPADEPVDEVSARILHAARVELDQFGIRRASIDEIARRAGVSRMTVHRRFPGKSALIEAVLLRAVREFFTEVSATIPERGTLSERVAATFAAGTARAVSDPLLRRLLDSDREAVLPFLTVAGAPLVEFAIQIVAATITADPAAAGLPADQVDHAAQTLVRLGHSIVLTAPTTPSTPSRPSTGQLDEHHLRELARAVLNPLLSTHPHQAPAAPTTEHPHPHRSTSERSPQ